MNGLKLWLDDIRPAPPGYKWLKNYDAAITALQVIKADNLDFYVFQMDHDLEDVHYLNPHEHHRTGYQVMCWMEENNVFPKIVIIHSFNPYGARKMFEVASKYTQAVIRKYVKDTEWL